jgi:3-methylfumaryl-CoA hydratase
VDLVELAASALPRQETPPAGTPAVVAAADDEWQVDVSPTLLFQFSALTFNAHRIHYDRDYARDVEGYPGLLTHGPLQALAMAEAARASDDAAARGDSGHDFAYRLESPLFDTQGLIARAARDQEVITTSVRDVFGRRTGSGTLRGLAWPWEPGGGPGQRPRHTLVRRRGHGR